MHSQLETALCEFLGVEHVSLFSNATLALIVALRASLPSWLEVRHVLGHIPFAIDLLEQRNPGTRE